MIKSQEIKNISRELGISNNQVIEKDYTLGHFLNAIYNVPSLSKGLVFKGGTSLRKCWFSNYRFSEDLDFTIVDEKLANLKFLKDELKIIQSKLTEVGFIIEEFEIEQVRDEYNEEAFCVKIPFIAVYKPPPILPKIKLDLTRYEKVLLPTETKSINHAYSDKNLINASVINYSLSEILSEKLRTFLQRAYPRDIYDVLYILRNVQFEREAEAIVNTFKTKCDYKKISFKDVNDFFNEEKISSAKIHWYNSLGNLINPLPNFDKVTMELREKLSVIFNK